MKRSTKTWVALSKNDLSLARDLSQKKGKYHYSVHFCHQALEKMLKAIISEHTKSIPYPVHNFKTLMDQGHIKNIPADLEIFLISMAPHYIGTKYPEDIAKLYKKYTKIYVTKIFKKTKEAMGWLEKLLK